MNFVGKTSRVYLALIGLVLIALLAGCTKPIPQGGDGATVKRFDNLRGVRYCEVFLIGGTIYPKDLQGAVYNTSGLNNAANPNDTCPAEMWAKVDPDDLKKKDDVWGVFKNGPRGWTMDWIELPVGAQRDLDGLQARWFAQVQLPKDIDLSKKGSSAYKATTVHRKSTMTFEAGKPVFILDDPQGTSWVMQASAQIVDPTLTYDQLDKLGDKLKSAPGWKFRVKVLDRDLTIKAVNGIAHIVQDDLENTYDQCFEADGQTSCTFKP